MARTATAEAVQAEMFPELNLKNDVHKKLLSAAKKFHKLKSDRHEALTTAKEEEDTAMDKVVELMHEAKLPAFRFDGVEVKLVPTREKAKVKLIVEDDDEDPAEDPDE